MQTTKILYDGWPLAYEPNSPAALHLLAMLAFHPPAARAVVGLPAASFHQLPGSVEQLIHSAPNTDASRLRWEQGRLPKIAHDVRADLLHLTSGSQALFFPPSSLLSPAAFMADDRSLAPRTSPTGLAPRLREALAQGGLARLRGVLWPADLPTPLVDIPVQLMPPAVHPAFSPSDSPPVIQSPVAEAGLDIPETYVLYHGPSSPPDLRRLLEAWNWAAGALGADYPLLLVGLSEARRQELQALLVAYQLEESIRALPPLTLETLAALYRGCSALLHPASLAAWGDPMRHALACGKPVVGLESLLTDALAGPAAYLVPQKGHASATNRLLGAGLISVIVEESLGEALSLAARQRAVAWDITRFAQSLGEAYQQLREV